MAWTEIFITIISPSVKGKSEEGNGQSRVGAGWGCQAWIWDLFPVGTRWEDPGTFGSSQPKQGKKDPGLEQLLGERDGPCKAEGSSLHH